MVQRTDNRSPSPTRPSATRTLANRNATSGTGTATTTRSESSASPSTVTSAAAELNERVRTSVQSTRQDQPEWAGDMPPGISRAGAETPGQGQGSGGAMGSSLQASPASAGARRPAVTSTAGSAVQEQRAATAAGSTATDRRSRSQVTSLASRSRISGGPASRLSTAVRNALDRARTAAARHRVPASAEEPQPLVRHHAAKQDATVRISATGVDPATGRSAVATVELPSFASLMGGPVAGSGPAADEAPGAGASATRTAPPRRTRLSPGELASIPEEHPLNGARRPYDRPVAPGPRATSRQPAGVIVTGAGRPSRHDRSGAGASASADASAAAAASASRPQDRAAPARFDPALDAHVRQYGSEAVDYLLQHAASRGRTGTDAVEWVRRRMPLPTAVAPDSGRSRLGRLKDRISQAVRPHAAGAAASGDPTLRQGGSRCASRVTGAQVAHWNQTLEQMETRGTGARKGAAGGAGAPPPTRPAGAAPTRQPPVSRSAANPRPQDWYSDAAVAGRIPPSPAGSRPFTVEEWRRIEQRFEAFRAGMSFDAAARR